MNKEYINYLRGFLVVVGIAYMLYHYSGDIVKSIDEMFEQIFNITMLCLILFASALVASLKVSKKKYKSCLSDIDFNEKKLLQIKSDSHINITLTKKAELLADELNALYAKKEKIQSELNNAR
jgi:hypothetical protein